MELVLDHRDIINVEVSVLHLHSLFMQSFEMMMAEIISQYLISFVINLTKNNLNNFEIPE